MNTTTATTPAPAVSRGRWQVWTCANCRHETSERRKRCRECGTSRY